MKFSTVIAAAVLAFVASGAPLERAARRATTADLANVNASVGTVGAPVFVARNLEPVVYELHKRQDSAGLTTLVVNYLVQQKAPTVIIDLIKTAPAELIQRIMKLSTEEIKAVVEQLGAGRIPIISSIPPKEMVVEILRPIVPATTLSLISGASAEVFEKISALSLSQLGPVIESLKAGRIPLIPGVTDGVPGVDPAATVGSTPVAPVASAVAPVAGAPVAGAPVAAQPVAQTVGRKVKREFGRPDAPLMVRQFPPTGQFPTGQTPGQMPQQMPGQMPQQMPGQMPQQMPGQMPGQMPQMPPMPTSGAELKAQTIKDMTDGIPGYAPKASPQQIQFIQTVPETTFDSLLALEKQVGGENGQPFNEAVADQLDQYWDQLFKGQMPTIAATGTTQTAPVASAPAALPVASAPAALPVASAPAALPVASAPAALPVASDPAALPVASAPASLPPVGAAPVATTPGSV